MALVVEDGTGKTDAESYVSVTDADTYFTEVGTPTAWKQSTTGQKEQALRLATAYLDGTYGARYIGSKATADQRLQWPREDAYGRDGFYLDSNVVPEPLADATAEIALRVRADGSVSPDIEPSAFISAESKQIGDLRISKQWVSGGGAPIRTKFDQVEKLLWNLLRGSGSIRVLERA